MPGRMQPAYKPAKEEEYPFELDTKPRPKPATTTTTATRTREEVAIAQAPQETSTRSSGGAAADNNASPPPLNSAAETGMPVQTSQSSTRTTIMATTSTSSSSSRPTSSTAAGTSTSVPATQSQNATMTAYTTIHPTNSTSQQSAFSHNTHFSRGVIALIVLGSLAAIILCIVVLRRTMRNSSRHNSLSASLPPSEKESPIIGGMKERTGLTPCPSSEWTTFPADSPAGNNKARLISYAYNPNQGYGAGSLAPPPVPSIHIQPGQLFNGPPARAANGGLGIPAPAARGKGRNRSNSTCSAEYAVIHTASRTSFLPPTITITGSTPVDPSPIKNTAKKEKLVALSRASGCSWDESVGVELGAKLSKKPATPSPLRHETKLPTASGSGSSISSSSSNGGNTSSTSTTSVRKAAPAGAGFLRKSPSSGRKVKTPRSPLNGNGSLANGQFLYDIPTLAEKRASRQEKAQIPPTESQRIARTVNPEQRKERDNRALTAALGLDTPDPTAGIWSGGERPGIDSDGSPTLLDSYAYVSAYADGNRDSVHGKNRDSLREADDDEKSEYPATPKLNFDDAPPLPSSLLSPAMSSGVGIGTLMMTAYEDGGINMSSPSIPYLAKKRARSSTITKPPPSVPTITKSQLNSSQRAVPSLPPEGMPSLQQMALIKENPDYRSPTYSIYGMYKDRQSTPAPPMPGLGLGAIGGRF